MNDRGVPRGIYFLLIWMNIRFSVSLQRLTIRTSIPRFVERQKCGPKFIPETYLSSVCYNVLDIFRGVHH